MQLEFDIPIVTLWKGKKNMYAEGNFRTKKALREAIAAGEKIRVFQPGLGRVPEKGTVFLEGPNFEMHTWYAEGKVENGFLVKVK